MSTTGNLGRQAPDGHRWVWQPTIYAEPLHTWEVLSADDIGRECRYGTRPGNPGCGAQAVARLNLAGENQWPMWAHYCVQHLFTRQIIDGVLHTCVLAPIQDATADGPVAEEVAVHG